MSTTTPIFFTSDEEQLVNLVTKRYNHDYLIKTKIQNSTEELIWKGVRKITDKTSDERQLQKVLTLHFESFTKHIYSVYFP